jgi:hypothetical protein
MATKLEEKKAFKKLCDAFPDIYLSLDIDMTRYSDMTTNIRYKAYVARDNSHDNYLGISSEDPMEAVNDVLKHFDKEI